MASFLVFLCHAALDAVFFPDFYEIANQACNDDIIF